MDSQTCLIHTSVSAACRTFGEPRVASLRPQRSGHSHLAAERATAIAQRRDNTWARGATQKQARDWSFEVGCRQNGSFPARSAEWLSADARSKAASVQRPTITFSAVARKISYHAGAKDVLQASVLGQSTRSSCSPTSRSVPRGQSGGRRLMLTRAVPRHRELKCETEHLAHPG